MPLIDKPHHRIPASDLSLAFLFWLILGLAFVFYSIALVGTCAIVALPVLRYVAELGNAHTRDWCYQMTQRQGDLQTDVVGAYALERDWLSETIWE